MKHLLFFIIYYISLIFCCPIPNAPHPIAIDEFGEISKIKVISESSRRKLQSSTPQSIRILYDFSGLTGYTSEKKNYLIQTLSSINSYLSNLIQISRVKDVLVLPMGKCYTASIPKDYANGVAYDLVIFVTDTSQDSLDNLEAWSTVCIVDQSSLNRPVAGQLNIGQDKIKLEPFYFAQLYNTLIHEITHILGFNSLMYDYYVDEQGQKRGFKNVVQQFTNRGKNSFFIVTPNVKAAVQSHFACNSPIGGELEDQGSTASAGSHWERRTFGDEIMTASSIADTVYSKMTLALLQDSGWYKINYGLAENFKYGKNMGCDFLTSKCIINQKSVFPLYFADKLNEDGCYYDFTKKGKSVVKSGVASSGQDYFGSNTLSIDSFSDNCPSYGYYVNGDCRIKSNKFMYGLVDEEYGADSRCFTGTLIKNANESFFSNSFTRSVCLKSLCENSGGTYRLTVYVNNIAYNCPQAGGNIQIPGYAGNLFCPIANDFCSLAFANNCPARCSNKGSCNNGFCQCNSGYSDGDCGQKPCSNSGIDCSGNGDCVNGVCQCLSKYSGRSCNDYSYRFFCPDCGFNSDCYKGNCYCQALPNRVMSDCQTYDPNSNSIRNMYGIVLLFSMTLLVIN